MYNGIFIGKCSPESMSFKKTFMIEDGRYYSAEDNLNRICATLSKSCAKGMFKSAPELLAFWSEDD